MKLTAMICLDNYYSQSYRPYHTQQTNKTLKITDGKKEQEWIQQKSYKLN
jgi:hypothetical protein